MPEEEFIKLRKRGIIILWINLAIAIVWALYLASTRDLSTTNEILWIVYIGISAFLLWKRYTKKEKSKETYIFGETLGSKMVNVPQKFIMEAQMMSLVFIMLGGLAAGILTVFFTDVILWIKITAGISAIFGTIFLMAIIINTYQSYQVLLTTLAYAKTMGADLKELKGGDSEIKNG